MPKILKRKGTRSQRKFKPTWYKATVHSTEQFWNTQSFISTGKERFPLGNAYFIDEHGFRQYHLKFLKGITVYIDPEKTRSASRPTNTRSGRQLLERFYELKLKPLAFKWVKAKNSLETSHWICVYPAHYLVIVEQSDRGMHVNDHMASLYYRINGGMILLAQQEYEGHLKGNADYDQPSILQEELRDWRINRGWYQDASIRDAIYEI